MARALVAVGALLALLILGLAAVAVLGQEDETLAVDNLLSEDFTRAVALADQRDEPLVVADLTSFEWERLVLVEPGTPRAAVERHLGTEFSGEVGFQAGELLVFVHAGEVTRFADYRGDGRFADVDRPFADFTPATAVFAVEERVIRPARVQGS